MNYDIIISDEAIEMLSEIKKADARVLEQIMKKIETLRTNPTLGKPLKDDLAGCRSVRVVRERYRIVYTIQDGKVVLTGVSGTINIVGVGIRKSGDKNDIYNRLKG